MSNEGSGPAQKQGRSSGRREACPQGHEVQPARRWDPRQHQKRSWETAAQRASVGDWKDTQGRQPLSPEEAEALEGSSQEEGGQG